MIERLSNVIKKRIFGQALPVQQKFKKYQIGEWTYADDLEVLDWGEGAMLQIGKYCSIAVGVKIFLGGEHRTDWVTTFPFNCFWDSAKQIKGHPRTKGNVTIGNDVWIGRDAMIMSGVTIGDGAVIGAGSVVAKDVRPYGIVVGNPANELKRRFSDEVVAKLNEIRWWDWERARIENALPLLLSTNLDQFIEASEAGEI